jgi:hypothetical protein
MELNINLLKKKKSLFRVIFGSSFLLIAGGWIAIRFVEKAAISAFDWIYFGVFTLSGVFHMIEGLGFQFGSFFGKAHILINSEYISLKAGIHEKEQFVNWSAIKSMDYQLNKLIIQRTDDTTTYISLSGFEYLQIQEIRRTIHCIAADKKIRFAEINADT